MFEFSHWIESAGAIGGLLIIGGIIFAESGLLIGFFLPGDTLLFTAGFFAAQGKLPLVGVLLTIFTAAVVGDNVGYTIGQKTGPRLFKKKDGLIFKQENVLRAEEFYKRHGGKTIIIARFVPVVRTFAPMVAGVGSMTRKKFFTYNVIGAAIWTGSIVMAGYWLGSMVDPHTVEKYLLLAIAAAMALTLGPTIWHLLREKRLRAFVAHQFGRVMKRLKRPSNNPAE
jgi:membrane-associated protein